MIKTEFHISFWRRLKERKHQQDGKRPILTSNPHQEAWLEFALRNQSNTQTPSVYVCFLFAMDGWGCRVEDFGCTTVFSLLSAILRPCLCDQICGDLEQELCASHASVSAIFPFFAFAINRRYIHVCKCPTYLFPKSWWDSSSFSSDPSHWYTIHSLLHTSSSFADCNTALSFPGVSGIRLHIEWV